MHKVIRRLRTQLPEWTRVLWVSEEARAVWQPRISAFSNAWLRIERESVARGMRDSALQVVTPAELPSLVQSMARRNVHVLPLAQEGVSGDYSVSAKPVEGGNWHYRVALVRDPSLLSKWSQHWSPLNNREIGALLGFPECCAEFFERVWVTEGLRDTTLAMLDFHDSTAGPVEANILLRWLGVRFVTHLPCSFVCEESARIGREFAQLGRDLGYSQEVDWALDMLSWPIGYSALHGAAEIRTPVCKISTSTDITLDKHVVQRAGTRYPAEGARGLAFPYQPPAQLVQLTRSSAYRSAFSSHSDNGFSSLDAMNAAHDVVLQGLRAASFDYLLDLGCGDGSLLLRARDVNPRAKLFGVEVKADVAERARKRGVLTLTGSILETHWERERYDAVLLMPGRLDELSADERSAVLQRLTQCTSVVVTYAYGDWNTRYGSLWQLNARVGLFDHFNTFKFDIDGSAHASVAVLARE